MAPKKVPHAAAPVAAPAAAAAGFNVLLEDDADGDDSGSDSDVKVATKAKAKKPKAPKAAAGAGLGGSADGAVDIGSGEAWTTITDPRRARYEKSKVKKALEAQAELLRKQDLSTEEALQKAMAQADRAAAKLAASDAPFRITAKDLKGGNEKTKKKKPTGPKYIVISSEKQMVEVVSQIVSNVPNNHHLHLSAVGDKLQEMTNKSWKKSYAPTYGSLPEFFKAHGNTFYVDGGQRVMLRSEYNTAKANAAADPLRASDAPKKKKAKGSAAAGAGAVAGANGHSAVAKAGAAAADAADDSVALRVLLVLVLIVAVGVAVFCGLEGITFGQFVARLRAALL